MKTNCPFCPFITLVTDVDGVLTDGTFQYTADGKVAKTFGPHDSDGIKLIRKHFPRIHIVAISADHRGFGISQARLDDMNVPIHPVTEAARYNWVQTQWDLDKTIFVGDGYFDVPLLNDSGLSFVPANATNSAKAWGDVVLETNGGHGVFLEIALYLLKYFQSEAVE